MTDTNQEPQPTERQEAIQSSGVVRHDPYRPSNGTEGMWFDGKFCDKCWKDAKYRKTGNGGCDILCRSLAFDIGEPEYPKEWIYDKDGNPICTAFLDVAEVAKKAAATRKANREKGQIPLFA